MTDYFVGDVEATDTHECLVNNKLDGLVDAVVEIFHTRMQDDLLHM